MRARPAPPLCPVRRYRRPPSCAGAHRSPRAERKRRRPGSTHPVRAVRPGARSGRAGWSEPHDRRRAGPSAGQPPPARRRHRYCRGSAASRDWPEPDQHGIEPNLLLGRLAPRLPKQSCVPYCSYEKKSIHNYYNSTDRNGCKTAIRRFSGFPAGSLPRHRLGRQFACKILIRRGFSVRSRSGKKFYPEFPGAAGKGRGGSTLPSFAPSAPSPARRSWPPSFEGSPATAKSSATWRRVSTPTEFNGSGAICGVCAVRDDLPAFPSGAAGWYKVPCRRPTTPI